MEDSLAPRLDASARVTISGSQDAKSSRIPDRIDIQVVYAAAENVDSRAKGETKMMDPTMY